MCTTWLVGAVNKLHSGRTTNRDFIPFRAKDFSSPQNDQTSFESYPDSCAADTVGEAAGGVKLTVHAV